MVKDCMMQLGYQWPTPKETMSIQVPTDGMIFSFNPESGGPSCREKEPHFSNSVYWFPTQKTGKRMTPIFPTKHAMRFIVLIQFQSYM